MKVTHHKPPEIFDLYDNLKSLLGKQFEFGLYGEIYIWAVPKTMFSWIYHFLPAGISYGVIIWCLYTKQVSIYKPYLEQFVEAFEKMDRKDFNFIVYDSWVQDGGP